MKYTIQQLYDLLQEELLMCNTEHEKIMCRTISGKEIRDRLKEIVSERKPTPTELNIGRMYGY